MGADVINALKETPIPTLLIFAGLFFILLAFVSKVGGFIEVQPTQQKWAAPIGIALLVLGLILALNTSSNPSSSNPEPSIPEPITTSTPTPQPSGCDAFFSVGSVLSWETRDQNGVLVNRGTLTIEAIDSAAGTWQGEQMTEPKGTSDRVFIALDGSFNGSEMTLNNPKHEEIWSGRCGESEIEGDLDQKPNRQFTFLMRTL